ncbi:hypothetical protein [Lunatibacter salilacus]|uniref:hypothetical protein n=1 Tax=Lunatibacter salilacus TaxID=2483804 RepID=UPI00131AA9AD|nr:hypothetical protein [Lunatibacter salilacus]
MKNIIYTISLVSIASILVLACVDDDFWDTLIPETNENTTQAQNNTYVFIPALLDANDERVQQLSVPNGFQGQKFAEDIAEPRMMRANSTGQIYVANRAGEVLLLEDTNGDGITNRRDVVAKFTDIHDFTISGSLLYMIPIKEIYRSEYGDGTLGSPTLLTSLLPGGGQHPNRTLEIGPDGMFYILPGTQPPPRYATNGVIYIVTHQ